MEDELIELESQCIHNLDEAFLDFVTVDIIESGEVELPIGDLDRYLFWLDKALQTNVLIKEMNANGVSEVLQKRAIKLKILVDGNLHRYSKNQNLLEDMGFGSQNFALRSRAISKEIIELNIEIGMEEKFLTDLYTILNREGSIKCSFSDFAANFLDRENTVRINWLKSKAKLVGLIKYLILEIGVIKSPVTTEADIIYSHFLIRGEELNFKSTQRQYSNAMPIKGSNYEPLAAYKLGFK